MLAAGQLTTSPHDTISVELVEPHGIVRIGWPIHPTTVPTASYTEVAALAMRLLANASTGPAVQHRLVTKTTPTTTDPGQFTTLDSAWW